VEKENKRKQDRRQYVQKGQKKGRKGVGDENIKEIISPRLISTGLFH
jgi:hypothetical protein